MMVLRLESSVKMLLKCFVVNKPLILFFWYHLNAQNNEAEKEGLNSRQILFCGLLN